MESIIIKFDPIIEPSTFKRMMEQAGEKAERPLTIEHINHIDGEDTYKLSAEKPETFYFAGIAASKFFELALQAKV